MKNILFVLCLLLSSTLAFAGDTFPLKEVKFDLKAENVELKTREALADPEPILIAYRPVDAVITNKVVRGNVIEFDATKTILGIKKTGHVYGILTITPKDELCPGRLMGYALLMDLKKSSDLVSDNVEKLTATLCFDKKTDTVILGQSKGLIYKGDHYNPIEGAVIRTFIDNQIGPIIEALKFVVEN